MLNSSSFLKSIMVSVAKSSLAFFFFGKGILCVRSVQEAAVLDM